MSCIKSENTTTEMTVRRLIFGMGYRYRLHDKRLPGKPDLVFKGRRKAIFVNGCFWHGHESCRYATIPKTRTDFWRNKIEKNRARDIRNIELLENDDWKILVVWQCELKDIDTLTTKLYDFLENNE